MSKNYKERMRVELIDEYIQKNNITKLEFCEMSKVDNEALEKMFNNDYDFDIIYLYRVCKILGVEIRDFFVNV